MSTADRDDLDAILAKHEPSYQVDGDYGERQWIECTCDSEYFVETDAGWAEHRAHVAQMVLESDWLRGVRRDDWAAGYRKGADDHYKCGDVCKVPTEPPNPYRADRVDAEDGGR